MSEFSESYHLRSERAEDAVELLQRIKRKGFVFPPGNGWVTFVAEEGKFEPDMQIVSAAARPLLHFVSAEDHGWSFTLFDRGRAVSAYECEWDSDIQTDDSRYSREALMRLVPAAHGPSLDEFERRMRPEGFGELIGGSPARVLAEALGLEHYQWISYDTVATDFEEESGVIEVPRSQPGRGR